MKRKLLLAACLVAGAVGMKAQTDVTATYITNADFASTDGWTANHSSQYFDIGNGLIGTYQVNAGTAATVDEDHPATDYCLGFQSRWSTNYSYYTQTTGELPAGYYSLTFDVQNTNSGTTNCVYDNLFSVTVGDDKYIDSDYRWKKTEWMKGNTAWTTHTINFRVKTAQAVTISLGYGQATNNYGNTATPYIYVSNLKLQQLDAKPSVLAIDKTSLITNNDMTDNVNGWSTTTGAQNKARATNQTGDFRGGFYENWNGSAYTGKMYQTVSGLPTGVYELSLSAFVNTYGDGETQYIYAGDAKTGLTTGTPTQYTVTNVEVTNGTLEIGFEQTVATANWCGIDYATLTKIGDPDLSAYVTAWGAALTAAKAFDQTQTMSATWKAALNTAISTYDDGQVDEDDQDALETATAALEEALAMAEKSVASYAIIAAGSIPDNSLTGWVCENSNAFHINTWSTEGNSDGSEMKTPFIENWVGKGSYLGAGKVYYQLAGLEPGEVYYAQALVRSYNEASSDAPNGPDFFINDVVTSLSTAGTTFTYNNMSGIYATLGGAATVGEDGILKLGVEIAEDRNYNWVAFKSVSIQSMDDAFDAAVAKVTALEGTIPTAAYNAAYAVVTTNSGDNYPTTAAGFETAIAAIEAAATSAAAMQKPYANWNTQKAIVEHNVATSTDNESARTTLSDALSTQSTAIENATTVEGINNVISALKTANYTYAQVATPTTEGDYIDCTTMLTNPDVTELSGNAGWKTEQEGGNFGVTTNAHRDGYATAYSIEYWSGTAQANDKFSLYDEVTLPAGTYEMSCYAFASPNGVDGATNNAVYFYANDTQGSLISSTDLEEATLSFVNASEQAVKIGLKTLTGNQYRWMGIGYVSLYKVPANAVTIDEDEDYTPESVAATVTLKRTIKANTWNTFVVPFQINNTELKAAFGDDVAVAEFSENSENADDVTVTFNTMETPAIAPNKPVLLKTSTAGSEYTFEGRTIATGEAKVAGTNIDFVGTYAATTDIAEGDYFIASDKLYKSTGSTTIAGTRAYLKAKTAGAKVRMIIDDEATGIEGIAADAVQNGKVYDLSGRLVKNPTKGLYIQNGKKYFVK